MRIESFHSTEWMMWLHRVPRSRPSFAAGASAAASLARAAALVLVIVVLVPRYPPDVISYVLFGAGLLEGLLTGFQISPLEALYADSTPAGDRARWFTLKGAASNIGMAAGPAVSVAIFLARSDTWTTPELSMVILAAAGIGVAEAAALLCLRDMPSRNRAGGGDGGSGAGGGAGGGGGTGTGDIGASGADGVCAGGSCSSSSSHSFDDAPGTRRDAPMTSATHNGGDGGADDGSETHPCRVRSPAASSACAVSVWVAALVAVQDVLTGLGSGMCYKFQPLFLWRELHLSPVATNAIMASFQVGAAVCQLLIAKLARLVGGPAAAILFRAGGIGGLAVVIFCTNHAAVVAALVVRGALMNAIDGALTHRIQGTTLHHPCHPCSPLTLSAVPAFSLGATVAFSASAPRPICRAHQVHPKRARAHRPAGEVEHLLPRERDGVERDGVPGWLARRPHRLPPDVLHYARLPYGLPGLHAAAALARASGGAPPCQSAPRERGRHADGARRGRRCGRAARGGGGSCSCARSNQLMHCMCQRQRSISLASRPRCTLARLPEVGVWV